MEEIIFLEDPISSKNEYINNIYKQVQYYENFPRPFKGVLSEFDYENITQKDLYELYVEFGIFIKYVPPESLRYDPKKHFENQIKLKGEFFGIHFKNPILVFEFLSYLYVTVLYEIFEKLELDEIKLEIELNYQSKLDDKRTFLKKKKNKILKKINRSKHSYLFQLYHSEDLRFEIISSNWLVAVNYIIEILDRKANFDEKLFTYITKGKEDLPNPYDIEKFRDWVDFEYLIHKLELTNNFEKKLENTGIVNYVELTQSEQKFLNGMKPMLENENNLIVFENILKLNEEKNIPFFTAMFNCFSGADGLSKKLIINNKPKKFFEIVNSSYTLDMHRLVTETGDRPNRLRELFDKIYMQQKQN